MSATQRLIEKLGLAILGEDRDDVLWVLAAFTRELLDRWGVSVDEFMDRLAGVATRPPRN